MIEVRAWGIAGSVQDLGHSGRAWWGMSRGGAVDPVSLALANRLVGNPDDAAGLETSGGMVVHVTAPTMLAIAGAVVHADVEAGPPLGWGAPVALPAGATVRIGALLDGTRAYLAVRGGVTGGGDAMTPGPDPGAPAAEHPAARHEPATTVTVWPGPRLDWFAADAWTVLTTGDYTVTATSRVGTRLSGPTWRRLRTEELPSEGMVEGAVQVPPDGGPIVMLADHPTTGGYPVVAVVDPAHLHHVAQAAPGSVLRFRQPAITTRTDLRRGT